MIVRKSSNLYGTNNNPAPRASEPPELAYWREQERRERQADEMEVEWTMDCVELQAIVRRWGSDRVLNELKSIHKLLHPDGKTHIAAEVVQTARDSALKKFVQRWQ
ncbi:hypothetical protein [Sphaerothrix gracilis]|uniref:hypothetical protein n=1 Tax=Sphaerothrix gracilis TaxID=3151835 RepID=UPI0031FC3B5F